MPTAYIPISLRVTAREGRHQAFRTDIERLTMDSAHASLSTVGSTDKTACLRGAVATGEHTASEAALARFLEDRLVTKGIHLDITANFES